MRLNWLKLAGPRKHGHLSIIHAFVHCSQGSFLVKFITYILPKEKKKALLGKLYLPSTTHQTANTAGVN